MAYTGHFELGEKGITLQVRGAANGAPFLSTVYFTWDTIRKMEYPEREMQTIIARVLSRTIASLED